MSAQLFFARRHGKRMIRQIHYTNKYTKNLPQSPRREAEGEKRLKANRVLREDISESGEPCLPPEQLQYLTLIQHYSKDRTPDRALKILQHAREKKQVHSKHFGAVIKTCTRANQPWKALEVLEQMKADGIQPNVVVYSTLMHGFAKRRELSKTQELFRDMEALKVEPNLVTYSSLIHAHSVHGDIPGVKQVFMDMVNADIHPDAFIISDMIASCAADANLPQAFEFYELISRLKIPTDISIYHAYMKCARSAENSNLVMKLYDKIIENGLNPTLDTYSHVLSTLAKPEVAYEFEVYWTKMLADFDKPNEYCWAAKMNLLNLQGKHSAVLLLEPQIIHTRVTRHEILRAYLALDDQIGAEKYFDQLPKRTYEHYRALIAFYVEKRLYDSVDSVFRRGLDSEEFYLKWANGEVDVHFFDRNVSLAAVRYALKQPGVVSFDLLCGRGVESAKTLTEILPEFLKNHLDVRLEQSKRKPGVALRICPPNKEA